MKNVVRALTIATSLISATAFAVEGQVPPGHFGHLDRVFLIIMENQSATDILGNANAPFINAYAKVANQATNYFAVGHPSAPNYLEIVGGSNFNVSNDFWPNWTNGGCVDNSPGSTGCIGAVTPIAGTGTDNTVVATATTSSQCNGQIENYAGPVMNNCALYTYPATTYIGKSIAHQLVQRKMSWKTYQESLPMVGQPGVYGINYADGAFSNLSPAGFQCGRLHAGTEALCREARSFRLFRGY
jgi:phosphatidylinositol-3-phosphatase